MDRFGPSEIAVYRKLLDHDSASTPDTIECPFDLDQRSEVDRKPPFTNHWA